MSWPIIIGRDLLEKFGIKLQFCQGLKSPEFSDDAFIKEICAIDTSDNRESFLLGKELSNSEKADILSIINHNYINFPHHKITPSTHKMKISLSHDTPMPHVDALSRTEAVGALCEVDLDFQLSVAQMRDPNIEALKRRLETEEVSKFTLRDGLNHGITHVLNATASPQANGQVERVNHELTEYLDAKNDYTDRDLGATRSVACANILKSQSINEKYFNDNHKPAPEFQIGDYVVIRHIDHTTGSNKKLAANYRGPYIVYKKLPNDRYVIRDIEGCQITQMPYDGVLEADKLKKWINTDTQGSKCIDEL
ncbi:uncharacterized protein LOC131214375 [Anopheles bellator]|uniref:uncharacterized protein LOC131214375 n=1 Tax=Anopheles bellator TaxID=139047 RepID=UPI002648BBBD|nr:uncharacterized protein LOC131214375 [Anopheles bellator]